MDAVSLKLARNYTNEKLNSLPSNRPTKTVSFDGGIYSVGNDVVNGQVSDIVIKGRSLKNELNYNCETWAEWTAGNVTKDISGLTLLADGVSFASAYINIALKTSTKYGVLFEYVSKSTVNKNLIFDPNNYIGGNNSSVGTLGNKKVVFTTPPIIAQQRFQFFYDIDTAGGHCKVRDIRLFELPAGSDIESDFTNLTADQLSAKYQYIKGDGVKSTNSVRIRSVNEDETKESIAYVNLPQGEELRSLPNGVKDEVNVTSGVKTQRVSDNYILTEADIEQIGTVASNVDYVITRVLQNKSTISSDVTIVNTTYIPGRTEVPNSTSAFNDVKYIGSYANRNDGKLIFVVAKGTTLAQAKTALAGTTLTYQLATPIVTKLPAQAPLQVFENGTVYVEPIGDASESTLPSVEMTIPTGTSNKFGVASHDYDGAAVDWTLTNSESKCFLLAVSNAGGAANIIAPDAPGVMYAISNASLYTITIKISGGTGVKITNAKTVLVIHNGTDYVALTAEL